MTRYVDRNWIALNSDANRNVGATCIRCEESLLNDVVCTDAGHICDECIDDEYEAAALEVAEWFVFAVEEWMEETPIDPETPCFLGGCEECAGLPR